MKNQDGKDVEKVFRLTQDAEYLDSTGHVATLDVFRSGDQVLVIEGEGHITGLKKSDKKSDNNATASKPRTDDKKSSNKRRADHAARFLSRSLVEKLVCMKRIGFSPCGHLRRGH